MRIRESILGNEVTVSSALHRVVPPEQVYERYELFSTFEQFFIGNLRINYLTESRTSDTQALCAIVSARRLCGY